MQVLPPSLALELENQARVGSSQYRFHFPAHFHLQRHPLRIRGHLGSLPPPSEQLVWRLPTSGSGNSQLWYRLWVEKGDDMIKFQIYREIFSSFLIIYSPLDIWGKILGTRRCVRSTTLAPVDSNTPLLGFVNLALKPKSANGSFTRKSHTWVLRLHPHKTAHRL